MVSPRVLPVMLLVALAACGGGTTEPVEPPLQQVSRITYATDNALVFTGQTVAVRDLVKAYDAGGVELPSTMLSLTLPAGWTQVGDSLRAPSAERVGALRAAAKASHALTAGGARFAVGDAPTDSTVLTAGVDLRAYHITASWSCAQPAPNRSIISRSGLPVDSMLYRAVAVDSVVYPLEAGWVYNFGGAAQLRTSGTAFVYVRDGSVDTATTLTGLVTLARQAPDSLVWGYPGVSGTTVSVKTAPTTYTGGTWCDQSWPVRGEVTVTATPR